MTQPWESDRKINYNKTPIRNLLNKTKKVVKQLGVVFVMSSLVYFAVAKQSFKPVNPKKRK